MEPKGIKNLTQNPYRFCVAFLTTFGTILAPKMVLFVNILVQKHVFFKKCQPCENTAPATQIQGSGPSKRVKIVSKIVTFADMVSGPVLERFFIDFGAHFGSLLGIKIVRKGYKNVFHFQTAF